MAGVTRIGLLDVVLGAPESVALELNLAIPVGSLAVSGSGCSSSVTLAVGDIRSDPSVPGSIALGRLTAGAGCLSRISLTVGDVENQTIVDSLSNGRVELTAHTIGTAPFTGVLFLGCIGFQCGHIRSSVVEVRAASINELVIDSSSDSTMTVRGMVNARFGVNIQSNANLTLGAPLVYGDVRLVSVSDNTFASPPQITIGNEVDPRDPNTTNLGLVSIQRNTGLALGGISMGDIAGDLTIQNNHGFSNADASDFADARTVAGVVSISGNTP